MPLKPIRSEQDYKAALRQVSPFFDNEPEPGTPEAERFELLAQQIETYEAEMGFAEQITHRK
jgi:HTH-type transcriptional regulator / antitoxin HigA